MLPANETLKAATSGLTKTIQSPTPPADRQWTLSRVGRPPAVMTGTVGTVMKVLLQQSQAGIAQDQTYQTHAYQDILMIAVYAIIWYVSICPHYLLKQRCARVTNVNARTFARRVTVLMCVSIGA